VVINQLSYICLRGTKFKVATYHNAVKDGMFLRAMTMGNAPESGSVGYSKQHPKISEDLNQWIFRYNENYILRYSTIKIKAGKAGKTMTCTQVMTHGPVDVHEHVIR
jgi:hypothetical protein